MVTRLYVITNLETGDIRLVESGNPAAARSHVARKLLSVHVAKATEAASLVKAGVDVEVAGEEEMQS